MILISTSAYRLHVKIVHHAQTRVCRRRQITMSLLMHSPVLAQKGGQTECVRTASLALVAQGGNRCPNHTIWSAVCWTVKQATSLVYATSTSTSARVCPARIVLLAPIQQMRQYRCTVIDARAPRASPTVCVTTTS